MTVIVTADKQSEDLFFFSCFCCSHAGNIYADIAADQLTIFLEGAYYLQYLGTSCHSINMVFEVSFIQGIHLFNERLTRLRS